MHAVWCISVLQIHQIHQYCKCVLDNWQLLVLHGRFLQFSMYHTDAPLWYHSDFKEGVVCQFCISVLIAACDCRGMVLKVKTWQISENPTSGQTEGREWGMQACPTILFKIMKFSFATSQVLHKQEISCMTFTCQSKSPQTKWTRSSGTWLRLTTTLCVWLLPAVKQQHICTMCVTHFSESIHKLQCHVAADEERS